MGESKHDGLAIPGRVVLAHEPRFTLGILNVDPATRQVEAGDRSETLEPRVMQALVALFQAGGVITRDELVERCWEGRVVGEDAINRVISRLRHVATDIGQNSFSIETITKVGFRLIDSGARNGIAPLDSPSRAMSRRALVAGAVAVGTIGIGALFWPFGQTGSKVSPESRRLYELAIAMRLNSSVASNRHALAHLREAVRLSPEFGEAWGALALTYREAILGESPERVVGFEQRMLEAARNAERFDPGNADAAAALLPSKNAFSRWLEHEQVFRAAVRRHPAHAAAYSLLGTVLMDVGRWTDASEILLAAKERNPRSPLIRYKLIVSLWSAGRISAAEDEIEEAMKLWPQHGAIWQTKVKILGLTGRAGEALSLASNPAAMPIDENENPNHETRLLFLTALATGSSRDVESAVDSILASVRRAPQDRMSSAINLAALGRSDLSLDMLDGIFFRTGEWALPPADPDQIATHPLFQPHARPLWREPRFNKILKQVGLEGYWTASGTRPDYRRA